MKNAQLSTEFTREGVVAAFHAFFPEHQRLTDALAMREAVDSALGRLPTVTLSQWGRFEFERALLQRLRQELTGLLLH